ncbi:MAG: hypothetical protein ACRYF0_09335 [Janthinobacterium lividum]
MQPGSPLPPQSTLPAEPSILGELAACTGLLNSEIIWKEEALLDDMDEQETQWTAASANLDESITEQP